MSIASELLVWNRNQLIIADCIIEEMCPSMCAENLLQRLSYLNEIWNLSCSTNGDPFSAWTFADLSTDLDECFCLCGHRVKVVHNLNVYGHQIRVGSRCIQRFFPWLYNEATTSARYVLRKTTCCPRCTRTRLLKGRVCPCEKMNHCKLCDKAIQAGDFCLECTMDKKCTSCHNSFHVKACMSWWTLTCQQCPNLSI